MYSVNKILSNPLFYPLGQFSFAICLVGVFVSGVNAILCRERRSDQPFLEAITFDDHDARLPHSYEARRGLLKRWCRQKLNRKLKIKIAQLTEEVLQYAMQPAQ
ncbi:hypothetical protein IscW_ISCW004789 [Ixodes scapularis]|uniref:Uncharacterized protein n=1 Tax=Ixodes scapularis TaxID=6945 RepID=B7PK40_IXOSC|nr:hypothetical protein IscW_ISCW004789 [Ixodes scapularis]|eukprot:XP_002409267.1 hypothetical protein IscW_ISCW004789 [Ixodes scapularis]